MGCLWPSGAQSRGHPQSSCLARGAGWPILRRDERARNPAGMCPTCFTRDVSLLRLLALHISCASNRYKPGAGRLSGFLLISALEHQHALSGFLLIRKSDVIPDLIHSGTVRAPGCPWRPAHCSQLRFSIDVMILRSDTGVGVPIVCAKRLTRSSSICQRISLAAAPDLASGGQRRQGARVGVLDPVHHGHLLRVPARVLRHLVQAAADGLHVAGDRGQPAGARPR